MSSQFYADKVNSQFSKRASHYVGLDKRLRESVTESWQEMMLASSIEEFKIRNPSLKEFNQLTLCRALKGKLSLFEIDTTLQRVLNLTHLSNIIDRWNSVKASPICVYEDPARPGKYICWDGQHTLLALFIIATKIMGEDPNDIEIPMVIYSSNQKAVMRDCFISLNGDARVPLDSIDTVHQKIYGVRTDGSKNPDWLEVEKKQQYLEQYKLFLTHDKFGDTNEPGALTRVDEFTDHKKYPSVITENFAKYFFAICRSNRPVMMHESWAMYDFFKLCHDSKITVDDTYIANIAVRLKVAINDNHDFLDFYRRAKDSWREWFRDNKPTPDGTTMGISYPARPIMMTFLLAQIRKNFNGPLPKYNMHWNVPTKDLY